MPINGFQVYAIGVGNEVDEAELWNIASPPKLDHMFLLNHYDALEQITNSIINVTCDDGKWIP